MYELLAPPPGLGSASVSYITRFHLIDVSSLVSTATASSKNSNAATINMNHK